MLFCSGAKCADFPLRDNAEREVLFPLQADGGVHYARPAITGAKEVSLIGTELVEFGCRPTLQVRGGQPTPVRGVNSLIVEEFFP